MAAKPNRGQNKEGNSNNQTNENKDSIRVNGNIKASSVRLVDVDGEPLGVMDVMSALRMAKDKGLDLVEVSPNAVPAVCKIMDYSKYKYELKKKKNQAKKNQKVIVLKEIHLTIRIGEEDYKVKLRQCAEFIKKQYKVKVLVKLKGREIGNIPEAMGFLDRIYKDLGGEEIVKMDKPPQKESTGVACIICANVK